MNTLVLDTNWEQHHYFNKWYYDLIRLSNVFEIRYEDLPLNKIVSDLYVKSSNPRMRKIGKFGGLTFIKINNRNVAIDTWSHANYLEPLRQQGILNDLNPVVYIKLDQIDRTHQMFGYKTDTWVMFADQMFSNKFTWENKSHKYLTMFTSGTHSFTLMKRKPWREACIQQGRCFVPEQGLKVEPSKFLEILADCKLGLSIIQNAYKNTREYEFVSNKMPIALNYKPFYSFPFLPNKHYIHLTDPCQLGELEKADLSCYAAASTYIWDNYFNPDAACRYLLNLAS